MKIAELVEVFRAKFKAQRGVDAECPGLVWADIVIPNNPTWTLQDFADKCASRNNHSYLTSGLRFCWDDLTERQRMIYLVHLADNGGLKPVLKHEAKFTDAEAAFMDTKLRESGSTLAADELLRKRVERDG